MNELKKWFQRIIPPANGPVARSSLMGFLIFWALFTATVCLLVHFEQVVFRRPEYFLLCTLGLWIWWLSETGNGGLRGFRRQFSLWIRFALVGLFAALMADPRSVRTQDVVSVVYAVDVSESVGETIEGALSFVAETVTKKPTDDEAGIVVFGRNAAVELPPRKVFPMDTAGIINSMIDKDATNLEQTLSLASAMLPDETRGRIVLISDGVETEGSIDPILNDLKARGIRVDVLPIEYQYQSETWVERLDLPRFVSLGETYEASVLVSSLSAGKGNLVLTENGKTIATKQVEFPAGKSRFTVPITLRNPGYYEYAATLELPVSVDQIRENNTAMNYLYIRGKGKVLVVVDQTIGDPRDYQPLIKAIQASQRDVQVIDAFDLPDTSVSLLPYDLIMFVNVPSDAFSDQQLRAVHDGVRDLGLGFVMLGSGESFGPGGYRNTPIEEALPVSMDIKQRRVMPKGALAIVLHTCEFAQGNTWAKRITKQAIKVLNDHDEAGALGYGPNGTYWIFELTPVSEYDELTRKINGAVIGDMPSFVPTMSMALNGLKNSDASAKHLIIISDGDPTPPPPDMVAEFIKAKITVSMVAIFPHGGNDISKMRAIASATGGRYYFPSDPKQLPSIFIKESKTLNRTLLQNRTVSPILTYPSPIVKGLDGIPDMHGYVITTAKPRAEVVLEVEAENPSPDGELAERDPLLATWRYGLGNSAAFTSDLSTNWGRDWVNWGEYRQFVDQLLLRVARAEDTNNLKVWMYPDGNRTSIVVEDFASEPRFLDLTALVTGPQEKSEQVQFHQTGPGRYEAELSLWGEGRYQTTVMTNNLPQESQERAVGGLILPYSPEYLRFEADPLKLEDIAERTGGSLLKGVSAEQAVETIYGQRDPKQSTSNIFDWLLMSLLILIPLDVAVRRIQFDLKALFTWKKQATTATTETMQSLRSRTKELRENMKGGETILDPRPTASSQPTTQRKRPERPTTSPPKAKEAPKPSENENASTTGKLLKLKRKRDQDQQ